MQRSFRTPLARWGFTACAAIALLTNQPLPLLVSTTLAAYAWKNR